MVNKKKIIFGIIIGVALAILYVPILTIIIFSFHEGTVISFQSFQFGFQLFRNLFSDDRILTAIRNSLIIATSAALIATIIGTLASFAMLRMGKRAKGAMMGLNLTPMVNATIVTGVALMIMFGVLGMQTWGWTRLILAHTLVALPIVMIIILPRFKGMDSPQYDAAQDLGANQIQAFIKVIFPQILPAMIGAFLVGFTLSVDEFIITNYNRAGIITIPSLVYMSSFAPTPAEFRALSAIVFFVVLAALFIVNWRLSKRKKKLMKNK